MKQCFLALVMIVCSVSFVKAQEAAWLGGKGQNVDQIKKEILKLREDEAQAIKNKDARALCNLMADGWAGTTQVGMTIHKAQYCDEVTNGTLTFTTLKRDEVKFYVFGNDTVEEWWRDTSTMVYKGKTSHGPRKCSVVYSRVNGRWLDVAHMNSIYTVEQ
jgi:ketosteroid isomerase-like protein